jgi:predicted kinase
MSLLTLLVGPPGSGKTTFAKKLIYEDGDHGLATIYVNQDSQGKGHLDVFKRALDEGKDIIVDRMGFSKEQRNRYLDPAKAKGYETKIVVLHESYYTCFQRCMVRKDHETIKDEKNARSALNTFFTKYERVTDDEANRVYRFWPEGDKSKAIYSDLDGTLCDVEHRRRLVRGDGKKDWQAFFKGMIDDPVNEPVLDVLKRFANTHDIVYCSGRPDNWRRETREWLSKKGAPEGLLFMRPRGDSRQDSVVKEILLDFEILSRFDIVFCLDDRDQVVKMLRKRGFTVFQVAEGDF